MPDSEVQLQATREALLQSLGVLATDPAADLNASEERWVNAFFEAQLAIDGMRWNFKL